MADKKTQREKFEEATREFETDDSDEAFEAAVTKIAKTPKLTAQQIRELAKQARAERRKP